MSILDQNEIKILLQLLNDAPSTTLKQTCEQFQNNTKSEARFRFCHGLAFLLKDKQLLSTSQRICGLVLIHDICAGIRQRGDTNPFLNYLIHIAGDEGRNNVERILANDVIQGKVDDQVLQMSPEAILESISSEASQSLSSLQDLQAQYKDQLQQTSNNLSCFRQASIEPTINDADFKSLSEFPSLSPASPTQPLPTSELPPIVQILSSRDLHGFEPTFIRPVPPITPVQSHHFYWLAPQPLYSCPLYDNSAVINEKYDAEYQQLVTEAMEGTLNSVQLKRAQFLLRADPQFAVRHPIEATQFGKCLESNRHFVESVLKTSIKSSGNSELIAEYLKALVTVNASLNSLEVVNSLAMEDGLPQEFLCQYFAHVIDDCLQLKDEGLQNRRVKLVCVMFRNFIKKQVMSVESNPELSAELMNFCVQFSNVNEATALFRLLRQNMNKNLNDNQVDSGS